MLKIQIGHYFSKAKVEAIAAGLSAMAAAWPSDDTPPAFGGLIQPEMRAKATEGEATQAEPSQPEPSQPEPEKPEKLDKAEKTKKAKTTTTKPKADAAPSPDVVGSIAPAAATSDAPAPPITHDELLALVKEAADKKSIVYVKDAYRQAHEGAQRLSEVPPEKHAQLAVILRKGL